jgi:hypothetical protein
MPQSLKSVFGGLCRLPKMKNRENHAKIDTPVNRGIMPSAFGLSQRLRLEYQVRDNRIEIVEQWTST